MKKIFFILLLTGLILGGQVFAQMKDASPTALLKVTTGPTEEKDIKAFKDKIANVIKKNDKALRGFVISNKANVIKLKGEDAEIYEIKLDNELTKYFHITGTSKKEIKADDISKDDFIIVAGVLAD